MGEELRKSRLLAPSGRGRVFTQFLNHKFTDLSITTAISIIANFLLFPECLCWTKSRIFFCSSASSSWSAPLECCHSTSSAVSGEEKITELKTPLCKGMSESVDDPRLRESRWPNSVCAGASSRNLGRISELQLN